MDTGYSIKTSKISLATYNGESITNVRKIQKMPSQCLVEHVTSEHILQRMNTKKNNKKRVGWG